MASELNDRMRARILGMPGGQRNIVKINTFHDFNRTLFRYTVDELLKNPEKCDEIQILNYNASRMKPPEEKKGFEAKAQNALSELAQIAIGRMKSENCNGTAAVFSEFFERVFIPTRQEVA